MSLSETQSRAVAHGAGPCICLAGPGSGKTTVITERTKYLIEKQGISPSEILVITFTKAASIEMRERFHNAMKGRYAPVTFGTFHAVFFTILKAAYHYTAENIRSCVIFWNRWIWRSKMRRSFFWVSQRRSV